MKSIFCWGLLSCLILQPPMAQAQESPSLHDVRPDLDVKDMKTQLAETNLTVQKTDQGRKDATATVIEAYENIVPELCAPHFAKTLNYDRPSTDSFCLKYTQRLLALAPESPVGICARDGFPSATCQTAVKQIEFKDINSEFEAKAEASRDVDYQLQLSRTLPDVDKARLNFIMLEADYNASQDQNKLPGLIEPLKQFIRLGCNSLRVRYYPASPYRIQAVANPTPTTLSDMLQHKLDVLAHGKQIKKDEEKQTGNRPFRLVSSQCVDALKHAENLFPALAMPTCYRSGFFSPDCVTAIRKERLTPLIPATPVVGTPGPGTPVAAATSTVNSRSNKPDITTF